MYFEDTDSGGIVYYESYLKFMERVRTEWLRGRGIDVERLARKDRVLFAVRSLEFDHRQPARSSDALRLSVVLERVRRASLELWQEVTREDQSLRACILSAWMPIPCDPARFPIPSSPNSNAP